jgi:hypothetical protein
MAKAFLTKSERELIADSNALRFDAKWPAGFARELPAKGRVVS